MVKVFLGGTCADSKWRDEFIPLLKIDYFNPVVKKWTKECMEEELRQRQTCDFVLYVLSRNYSSYSIAEVIDDSHKRPEKTIVCVINEIKDGKEVLNKRTVKSEELQGGSYEESCGENCTKDVQVDVLD